MANIHSVYKDHLIPITYDEFLKLPHGCIVMTDQYDALYITIMSGVNDNKPSDTGTLHGGTLSWDIVKDNVLTRSCSTIDDYKESLFILTGYHFEYKMQEDTKFFLVPSINGDLNGYEGKFLCDGDKRIVYTVVGDVDKNAGTKAYLKQIYPHVADEFIDPKTKIGAMFYQCETKLVKD